MFAYFSQLSIKNQSLCLLSDSNAIQKNSTVTNMIEFMIYGHIVNQTVLSISDEGVDHIEDVGWKYLLKSLFARNGVIKPFFELMENGLNKTL